MSFPERPQIRVYLHIKIHSSSIQKSSRIVSDLSQFVCFFFCFVVDFGNDIDNEIKYIYYTIYIHVNLRNRTDIMCSAESYCFSHPGVYGSQTSITVK